MDSAVVRFPVFQARSHGTPSHSARQNSIPFHRHSTHWEKIEWLRVCLVTAEMCAMPCVK